MYSIKNDNIKYTQYHHIPKLVLLNFDNVIKEMKIYNEKKIKSLSKPLLRRSHRVINFLNPL